MYVRIEVKLRIDREDRRFQASVKVQQDLQHDFGRRASEAMNIKYFRVSNLSIFYRGLN